MKNKVGILAALLCASVVFSGPYDSWSIYRTVRVNTTTAGVSGTVTNYPLLVRLTNADSAHGSKVLSGAFSGGVDIRFTDSSGATALPYQIEQWSTTSAAIWVLVPSIAGNATTTIRMYWGKSGSVSASNGSAVFDTARGFVGVWHLGEATNAAALDATVNHFHGAPGDVGSMGVPTDTIGMIGQAKSFHGVNPTGTNAGNGTTGSYFAMNGTASGSVNTVTGPLDFAEGGSYTISAWALRYDSASGIIAGKGETQYYLGTRLYGAYWLGSTMPSSGSTPHLVYYPVTGTRGIWTYVSVVRTDGTTATLYVNGVPVATHDSTFSIGTISNNTGGEFRIGNDPLNTTKYLCFPGAIDEVEVSRGARDSNWIKLNYQTQKANQTTVALGPTIGTPTGIHNFSDHYDGLEVHMIGSSVVFHLPSDLASGVRVSVMDVWGRTVWSQTAGAGVGELSWNGKSGGKIAARGVYFVRLTTEVGGKSKVLAESKITMLP